ICDGYHVHAAAARIAVRAKGPDGIMAITDGTAGSGMAPGSRARLGGRTILIRPEGAFLEDGTLAGSAWWMGRADRTIVVAFGQSIVGAATMCATAPARDQGLTGVGVLAEGAVADFVILDRGFRVVRTFIDGAQAWPG